MHTTRIKSGTRLRDVAAAAGVSMATASAVVNGRAEQYGIAPATRRRIEDLIRLMDYRVQGTVTNGA
ncbi:MAG: LacI family DNA-binding transcriptional regulator [bacterium]